MYPFHSLASLAVVMTAIVAAPLRAEPSVIISLQNVGDRVRSQNPDLSAARLQIKEALGRMNQSGRMANPELETSFEHNSRYQEGKFQIGVSQKFPVTGKLLLEKDISLTELKAAEAEVREVERQITGKAREAVVKILASQKRRELVRERIGISQEFANFLAEIAKKGEGSLLDAGQAKLEASSLAMEIRQLEASETAFIGELKPLLGMRPGDTVNIGGSLTEPSLPANNVNPARRPDFQAAKLGAFAAAQGVALEQARRYEDWEGGLFTAAERSEDAPEGFENEAIVGLSLKVPLPLWNKNEGAIQEAEARKLRKEKEAIALSRNIRLEAEAARNEMIEWAQLAKEIQEKLLPLANEQAALAEKIYREGQGEIQSVLRTREKQMELSISRLDALREFHLARVRHETVIAKP
jgi:outer membrane protein, heavy metal efflux system